MQNYTLAFDPLFPYWALIGFGVIALAFFMLSISGNTLKASIRLAFAALLLVFLLQPQLVNEKRKPLNDVALIAVDKSLSQGFGQRTQISERTLAYVQNQLKKIAGLEVRTVDVAPNAADETKVFDSIEASLSDVPATQRAGTILITDGQVTDSPTKEFLKASPLDVLLTGSRHDKDREIKIINAPGYSVLGETVSLKFTVEDHNILNGLGSAVCEVVAEEGKGTVRRIGVQDQFGQSAPYEKLLELNGITVENIIKTAKELI